ncbi:MAG: DUF5011 domain-containing protein, partial [Candidatus Hydrogenedentes bacterium]|nr:DUF5011 domain-containing protein [Candidatus Hydrogenedentota bacterium]
MTNRRWILVIVVLLFASAAACANPLALFMSRAHAPVYTPGVPVEIVVTLEGGQPEGIKAMGLYETLPEGWRFEAVSTQDAQRPSIVPISGDGPGLEFAWIAPPAFPCSFVYTVVPAANGWGEKEIHGVLEYRLEEGAYYLADVVTIITGPEEQKPLLILQGEQVMEVMQYSEWEEPGYTAMDTNMRDISSRVVVSGKVDVEQTGTYRIKYRIASESGKLVTEKERVVQVIEEKAAPLPSKSIAAQAPAVTDRDARVLSEVITDISRIGKNEKQQNENDGIVKKRFSVLDLSAYRPVVSGKGEIKKDRSRSKEVQETEEGTGPVEQKKRKGVTGTTALLETERIITALERHRSDGLVQQAGT